MGGFGSKKVLGVDLAFDEDNIASDEKAAYERVEEVLGDSGRIHGIIVNYTGCQELARAAMSVPTPENEQAAFEGLLVAVDSIAEFFGYAKSLERTFPVLLKALSQHADSLDQAPGLTRQLARMFNFALEFDRVRMLRPNLSNDFSYYRRLLPKFHKHEDIKVKDDEASGMALFTAEHIPMTSCLAKVGSNAQEEDPAVSDVLANLANSCMLMLKNKKLPQKDQQLFCARAMAGSIVIFDHVDPEGAFHKRSPIALKQCITVLKKDFPKETALINAIHYSTKNFRDAPESIQNMFD